MSDPLIGSISIFAGNFAPYGYHLCDGSVLSIQQYSALFSILGTYYGGNGTSTFGLPDLRTRFALHVGQGNPPGINPVTLGQMAGAQSVTLTTATMPQHNHLFIAGADATTPDPSGAFPGNTGRGTPLNMYDPLPVPASVVKMNAAMTGLTGGNQPFSTQNPSVGLTYIIAITGVFPSRN